MMRNILFLLAFLLCGQTFGQVKEYNYQNYRQASTRLKQLDLTFDLGGNHFHEPTPDFIEDDRIHSVSLFASGRFGHFWNAPNVQENVTAVMSLQPRFSSSRNEDDGQTRETYFNEGVGLTWIRDNYIDYNRKFWGWQIDASQSFSHLAEVVEDGGMDEESQVTLFSVRARPLFRFGMGRHENITNAWHAYRILQRFNYLEMTRDFSHEEINAFGNFIDELRAMRVFDFRLTYIAHLKLLDDFLKYDLELDALESIGYFVELNDMWRYGISENRIKGKKLTFSIGPLADYLTRKDIDETFERNDEVTQIGAIANIDYTVGKPLKADKQFNWSTGLYVDYLTQTAESEFFIERSYDQIRLFPYAGALWGFYPTTRTEYEIEADAGYYFTMREFENDQNIEENQLFFDLQGRLRYWFTPRTTLNCSVRLTVGTNFFRPLSQVTGLPFDLTLLPDDNIRLSYGVRLNHALF